MTKLLDESWKNWTTENLNLGVPPAKIFETLISNEFDVKDIESIMGRSSDKNLKPVRNSNLSSNIISTSYSVEGASKIVVKDNKLELYQIDNFLTKDECDKLVKLIKSDMTKSSVSIANKAEGYIDDSVRTSSTCNLVRSRSDVVKVVDNKILECLGIHESRGESIQGQHYDKTQEFKQHTDTFAPNSEEYKLHCERRGGQRTWTFMIYLNNTKSGGDTKFNFIKDESDKDIYFKPKMGTAVVWNNLNLDGTPNRFSMHQGCPVTTGTKTIITKWFRERKI